MKPCKACCEEINDEATRCPRCQAFQNWYRNPQNISWVFILIIFGWGYWFQTYSFSSLLDKKDFFQYRDQFIVKKINEDRSNEKRDALTYKIINETDIKWDSIKYELIGTDEKGDLILTDSGSEYSWVIKPKGESYLTVKIEKNTNVKSWSFKIVDLDSD